MPLLNLTFLTLRPLTLEAPGHGGAARRVAAALAVAATLAASPALSAPPSDATRPQKPALTIELNTIEQHQSACRLTLLIENRLGAPVRDLAFEIVLFDTQKRIIKVLAVAAGDFPREKTRIQQFDIAATECARIGRILLNTITRCSGGTLTPTSCLEATITRSRTAVPLTY